MSEPEKSEREKSAARESRWPRVLQIGVPAVSAMIALASLLFTVAARKKELTCSLFSASSIVTVDPSGIDPDLRIQFRGEPIRTLSKLTFSIKNTGSAAIRADDIKEPVRVRFPPQAQILTTSVDGTVPQRFSFALKLDASTNAIICEFPLLNSGDEAFFSVYIQASGTGKVLFEGRVVDVPQMVYIDKSEIEKSPGPKVLNNHAVRRVVRWTLVVLYFAVAGFLVSFLIFGIISHIRRSIWMRRNRSLMERKIDELKLKELERQERTKQLVEMTGVPHSDDHAIEPRASDWYLEYRAASELHEEGVSKRPDGPMETTVGLVGGSFLLATLAGVAVITAWIVFGALRG